MWPFTRKPRREPAPRERTVNVNALICALENLPDDPLTNGFAVARGYGYMEYSDDVYFEGVCVASSGSDLCGSSAYVTGEGRALGPAMLDLMQAVIDRHVEVREARRQAARTKAQTALAARQEKET